MRKIFAYSIIVLLGLCAACTSGDVERPEVKVVLELDNDKVSISPDGGVFPIVVRSNDAWTLTCDPGGEWCVPSITSGEANMEGTEVIFSADMTYDSREALFWFESKGKIRQLVVSQKAKPVINPDANNHFEVGAEGAIAKLKFESTYPCTVVIPDDAKGWVEKLSTRALEAHEIELNIKANNTYAARSTTVKVVMVDNDDVCAEYTISQAQNDAILPGENNTFNVEASGARVRIDFKANVEWQLVVSEEGEEWIYEVPNSRALSDEYVELEVLENEEYSSRSATVQIVAVDNSTIYEVYTIIQAQKDAINAEIVEHTIDAEGGSVEIEFDTNVDYDIVISEGVDWITLAQEVETRALESRSAVLAIAKNEGYDGREATVKVVMSGNEELYAEYRIIQLQRDAVQAGDSGVEIAVASTGDDITISYLTNVACRVVIPEDIDWISLQQTRGLEAQSVVLNVAANTTHDSREGVVTVESEDGELSVEYTIIQAQMDDIILDGDKIEATVNGGSVELGYKANIGCEVVIPEEAQAWISVVEPEATRGLEEYNLSLVIAPNPEFESRETTISIKGAGINRDIKVSQEAKRLEVEKSEYDILFEGGVIDVVVDANVEYDTIVAEEYYWIKTAQSEEGLNITVEENPTIYQREAEVVLRHGQRDITITILQHGDSGVIEVDEEYIVESHDTSVVIDFRTNFEYEVIIPEECDWLYLPNTRAAVNAHSVTLQFGVNPKVYNRSADITIMDIKGSVSKVVRITQLGSPLLDVVEVQDNQIFYVSTDGNRVTPTVSSFGGAFMMENVLEDGYGVITFTDAVTRLGNGVFENCSTIEQIVIPHSITAIDNSAFANCHNLIGITIPAEVESIGEGAFMDCDAIKEIVFEENSQLRAIDDKVFSGCEAVKSFIMPQTVESIGNGAFEGCVALSEITTSNSLVTLGDSAFADCSSLTDIAFSDNLKSVGAKAFSGCGSLRNISLGNGVNSIKGEAFKQCVSLETVILPESVTELGNRAFEECVGLTKIVIPNAITKILESTFINCTSLAELTIGDSVEVIGNSAFSGCNLLKNITIPESVTTIEDKAFFGCGSVETITIPASVASIGSSVFAGCSGELTLEAEVEDAENSAKSAFAGSKFTKVIIGDSVGHIGDNAFAGCSTIASVEFGNGVTTIGKSAFADCSALAAFTLPEGLMTIGDSAFGGCAVAELSIPSTVTEIGAGAFKGCGAIESLHFAEGSQLATIGAESFSGCGALKAIAIPEGVHTIEDKAFYGCGSTTSVYVPSSVTELGESVFSSCGGVLTIDADIESDSKGKFAGSKFTKIIIGNGVSSIGDNAFAGCSTIESVEIGSGVTTIGKSAFNGCSSLAAFTLPEGLMTIGDSAFGGCAVAELSIPSTVTEIGAGAFKGCGAIELLHFAEGSQLATIGAESFSGCVALKSINIPASVVTIADYAFKGDTAIETLTFADNSKLTTIGKESFSDCAALKSLSIPASVETIGDCAFKGAAAIETLTFADNAKLNIIGKESFSGCKKIKYVEIPNSVARISQSAFHGCESLVNAIIGNGISRIDSKVFDGCKNLSIVYVNATTPPRIGSQVFDGCSESLLIYVPKSSLERYRGMWAMYSTIIVASDVNAFIIPR